LTEHRQDPGVKEASISGDGLRLQGEALEPVFRVLLEGHGSGAGVDPQASVLFVELVSQPSLGVGPTTE
jgi:hypothetical protein